MKVAIIGNGAMGSGIAQAFASCDKIEHVYLCGRNPERVQKAYDKIIGGMQKRVEKGKMEQAALDAVKGRLSQGLMDDLAGEADLVVESISEDMSVKIDILNHLMKDVNTKDSTIWATNTSSLSLTEISAGLPKPVVGMHFFNPAAVMKLVEVIGGKDTPKDQVDTVFKLSEEIGKVPVRVNESAGFVVNRILLPYCNEGMLVYSEGVASIEGIDTAMKLGCGHPMGPLELSDLIGLDVCLAIMEVLQNAFGDKYAPAPVLVDMVKEGKLGQKSGVGFYNYADGGKVPTDK